MLVPCVLQFRVTDSATGMLRDAYLGDHRQVDAKLQSQKAEMDKVNHHILTLRKNVSPRLTYSYGFMLGKWFGC